MQETIKSEIDEYIEKCPNQYQDRLKILTNLIRETIPNSEESISYQLPTFKINNKPVIYFGLFKNHIGFYPFPSGVDEFKRISKDFKTSTGSIQFPHSKELPLDLIKKIIIFRLKEINV